MEITKLIMRSDLGKKEFDFGKKVTVISSNNKNSQGKSTIIRSLLFGMGFIMKHDFVDGTKMRGFKTEIIFSNKIKVCRELNKIEIYRDADKAQYKNNPEKRIDIKDNEGQNDLIEYYKIIFKNNWEFVNAYLFSCYSDQQYGKNVINRGRTGPFPKSLSFSIEGLARSLDDDYDTLKILEKEVEKLKKYEMDLQFIKENSNIQKKEISLNDELDPIISQTIEMKNLEEKIVNLKKIKRNYLKRKNLLTFFENDFVNLDLIYKDDNGYSKPLSIDNFSDGVSIQKSVIDERINEIKIRIIDLSKKIAKVNDYIEKDDLIHYKEIQTIRDLIVNNKIKISENKYTNFVNEKDKLQKKISEIQNRISQKQMEILEGDIRKYLEKFGEVNDQIKIWSEINKRKNYEIFLDKNSRFVTYVGAIRFMLATSFKFAITQYLWSKGIRFPIIIDNLFPEELSDEIKIVYLKMLFQFKQKIIISEINKDFIKLCEDNNINIGEIKNYEVKKDIFKEEQFTLFSSFK